MSDHDIDLNKLQFSETKLYGRSSEISQLLNVWNGFVDDDGNVQQRPPEMVIISGQSGTGKTTIANKLQEPVKKKGGYFISGKFDASQRIEPYTALIAAFSELSDMISNDIHALFRLKVDIQEAVGTQGKALTEVIPSLQRIIKQGDEPLADVGPINAENRFKYVLRNFVRAVCSPSHPLVLFLDDLQWADPASLEVLQTLMADKENSQFLFIGSYRSDEVGPGHNLAVNLEKLKRANVHSTNIHLENLSAQAINDMISDVLSESAHVTESLADTVFHKTRGNVFYVIQFLIALYDKGLLSYSLISMRWQWNLDKIRSMNATKNVVDLLTNKLMGLPSRVRKAMMVAASLGSLFKKSVLKTIAEHIDELYFPQEECQLQPDNLEVKYYNENLEDILDVAAKEGLIEKYDDKLTYKFVHDQIQLAAFSLIPKCGQGNFLRSIGEILLKELVADELEKNLFVVVDLLNCEESRSSGNIEEVSLASLNFKASRKAISSFAFGPCIKYTKTGITLLGTDHWKEHYDLSLKLHSIAAEAFYCCGNATEAMNFVDLILMNAKSFDEKFNSYIMRIDILTSQGKVHEAIQEGFYALQKKGIHFHNFRKINSTIFVPLTFMKAKRLFDKYSYTDLSLLPIMDDEDKIKTMHLLDVLVTCSYQSRHDLIPLFIFKSVQLSIQYGLSIFSPIAFAMYGIILCKFGDCRGGFEIGQMALSMRDRLGADGIVGRIHAMVFGYINWWTRPAPHCMRPLVNGYQQSMAIGDVRNAMICIFNYAEFAFYSGYPLVLLEKDLRTFCHQMEQYNQQMVLSYELVTWQMVLNLMGQSDDPVVLTGMAMDQDKVLREAKQQNIILMINHIKFRQMMLYYYFGNYEEAAKLGVKKKLLFHCGYFVLVHTFFEGLVAVAVAKKEKQGKSIRIVRKSIKKMRRWADSGNVNCGHMISLLEAELHNLKGEGKQAECEYKSAVTKARKCGFIQDRALATEKLGIFFLDSKELSWASHYLSEAHQLWLEWGASSKAQDLFQKYPELILSSEFEKEDTLPYRTLLKPASDLIVAGPLEDTYNTNK